MNDLVPSGTGRWKIDTEDSIHILDLDARTHERRPLSWPNTHHGFDDHPTHYLITEVIEWPRVGDQFVVQCSLRSDPWQRRHVVRSAPITQISAAQPATDELADTLPGRPRVRIPSGWCALVMQLHHDLVELEPHYTVTTIKEKRQGLRLYINLPDHTPDSVADAAYARIDWAEEESENRCTFCGGPTPTPGSRCGRHPAGPM